MVKYGLRFSGGRQRADRGYPFPPRDRPCHPPQSGQHADQSLHDRRDIHVTPADSVERLQQAMTQFGVGQVPVVSDGQVVGVVTRTDLISCGAGRLSSRPPRRNRQDRSRLARPAARSAQAGQRPGPGDGYPLYVVGGFVRDLLLGLPPSTWTWWLRATPSDWPPAARDIDAHTRSHKQFGTAKIILAGAKPSSASRFLTLRQHAWNSTPTLRPTRDRR